MLLCFYFVSPTDRPESNDNIIVRRRVVEDDDIAVFGAKLCLVFHTTAHEFVAVSRCTCIPLVRSVRRASNGRRTMLLIFPHSPEEVVVHLDDYAYVCDHTCTNTNLHEMDERW